MWVGGRFVLEGDGPVPPGRIMDYERQGKLVWANPGARAWVGSRASSGASGQTSARTVFLKRVVLVIIGALVVVNLVLVVIFAGGLRLP